MLSPFVAAENRCSSQSHKLAPVRLTRIPAPIFKTSLCSVCILAGRKMARLLAGVFVGCLLLPAVRAATLAVTVNTTNQLTAPFLPAARSASQVENSPAWKASTTVLGYTTTTESLETLTPGAVVTLDWLTARTKQITLDQNTTFSFSNIPAASTNLQRMIVEVTGDGVQAVAFTGAVWQTSQVTTPDAGVITIYLFEASNSTVNGYTEGGSSSQQVFSGFYGGGLPTDVPTTTAALAFDLDPPNTLYMWDGAIWW